MSETAAARPARWSDLANPTRFIALADRLVPWLAALSALVLALGLWLAFSAPEDYQQGITVRIMYIHVPFAWLAMMCYSIMAVSSLGTLVWRHPLADVSVKAAAPIGAVFTLLSLITGFTWPSVALMPWLLPLRRLTWLRSVTWCVHYRVESAKARQRDKHLADATEDWSSEDVDAALTAHVEGRVAEYLDPGIIASIRAEWLGPDRLSF